MTAKPRHDFQPCVAGAFPGGLSRPRYFDGMVLSQADLMREQGYWGMKRRLTNRALGQGVVWGLGLTWNAKSRSFELCPGYGLSCCGDDLVVECAQTVREADLIDPCSPEWKQLLARHAGLCEKDHVPERLIEACLMLEYIECPEDPRRGYEDPCAPAAHLCQYGAVRETTRLRLVPPPPPEGPGPIERFCARIEAARAALEKAGVSLPKTHLGAGYASFEVEMSGVDKNGNPAAERADLPLEAGAAVTVALADHGGGKIAFRLSPPVGYVFSAVTVDGVDITGPETLMGLRVERTAAQMAPGIGANLTVSMIPLLQGTDTRLADLRLEAKGAAEVALRVEAVRTEPGRRDCSALLEEGLFLKGPANCTLRTLALAVMSGWFRSLLGSPGCPPGEQPAPEPAKVILAWLTSWLAWRVLFGIDIREDQARAVEDCLQRLFAEWCDGMHYKGPRCDHHQHGITLGSVMISVKGSIECFDEWAHRRHVLTGPLITHWAGQFGMAPIDVTAARLASWICCIGRTPLPEMPAELNKTGLFDFGSAGIGGIEAAGLVDSYGGIQVDRVRTVGALEFVDRVLRQVQRQGGDSPAGVMAYEVFAAPGLGLQMAVPMDAAQVKMASQSIVPAHEAVAAKIVMAPAMARAPTADLVDRLAESVAVADVKPPTQSPLFEPMVRALEGAQVTNIAELVALGPERALGKVRAMLAKEPGFEDSLSAERAMSLVYNAALRTLDAAAGAIVDDAAARQDEEPFLRSDLTDTATRKSVLEKVNPTLRRGLTANAMRVIAASAAGSKPGKAP
jgi:hypothetical protein